MLPQEDENILLAAADMVGHTGADHFETGYDENDLLWWASATYGHTRVKIANKPSPVIAADLLARRLINDGNCKRCGKTSSAEDETRLFWLRASNPERCHWYRRGAKWHSDCERPT